MDYETDTYAEVAAQEAAELDAYAAKWPGVCRKCNGYGYMESRYDPSPAGVSLAPGYMVEAEPCEACVCEGHCPRCGAPWPDDGDDEYVGPCASCGFVLYETAGVLEPVRV